MAKRSGTRTAEPSASNKDSELTIDERVDVFTSEGWSLVRGSTQSVITEKMYGAVRRAAPGRIVWLHEQREFIDLRRWLPWDRFRKGAAGFVRNPEFRPAWNWLIVSGGATPLELDWLRPLVDQCRRLRACFWFERWGATVPVGQVASLDGAAEAMIGDDRRVPWTPDLGCCLDGEEHRQVPRLTKARRAAVARSRTRCD